MRTWAISIALVGLTACGGSGWSEEDQQALIRPCLEGTRDRALCECSLEVAQEEWDSYAEYERDENGFRRLLELSFDCV